MILVDDMMAQIIKLGQEVNGNGKETEVSEGIIEILKNGTLGQ